MENTEPVRKALEKDIDAVHNILDMEPFKYNDEVPYDRSWIEQLVLNDRCLTLVYESENEIKGFISGEKMVSGAIMIWFCAVKKEFQNSIIGIKLYHESLLSGKPDKNCFSSQLGNLRLHLSIFSKVSPLPSWEE